LSDVGRLGRRATGGLERAQEPPPNFNRPRDIAPCARVAGQRSVQVVEKTFAGRTHRAEKIQMLSEARRTYDRLAQAGAFRGDPQFVQMEQRLAQLLL
jgi:hypothetical protein